MLDLIVQNAFAVLPSGPAHVDIGIKEGKIAVLAAPGGIPGSANTWLHDAGGRLTIPGGIDPHVHCSLPIFVPGKALLERSEPPATVSRAALHGGTTTLIDFVFCAPDIDMRESIELKQKEWQGATYCDYGLHVMIQGKVNDRVLRQVSEVISDGYASIKIFTTDITPSRKGRLVHFGDIWELMKVISAAGGILAVHAEDNDIVMHMYEKLTREGRTHFTNLAEVHNTLSEDLSFHRVLRLAANVEGAAVYMMHTSAELGVRALAEARANGQAAYGETLHQYLLYNAEDYKRTNGQIYHTYPSLKFPADQKALWAATDRGAIQTIATDEVCCPLAIKLQADRIDDTTGGNSGVEPRVAIVYSETVVKRGYTLNQFVDLVSTNAAKILGLYPRKGVIAVGADADIVILDRQALTVRNAELHETDYSPWEGRQVEAWPVTTVLAGKVVVDKGQFFGTPADGRFIPRFVGEDVRRRPAV